MGKEVELRKGQEWTPRQIAQLGPFGVLRMAFKLCYRSPLLTIQFAIVLPYTMGDLLLQHFQPRILDSILPEPWPSTPDASASSVTQQADQNMNWWLMKLLLIFTVAVFVFCVSLVIEAAVFSGAGSVYFGKYMTLAEVFRSVPRLWKRLFVTHIYGSLLFLAVGSVSVITFFLFWQLAESHPYWSLFMLLLGCVSMIPLYVIAILSKIAVGVTCYEERYGWAAYTLALKLLRSKWVSATFLVLMYGIPSIFVAFGIGLPAVSAESLGRTEVVSGGAFIFIASWAYQLINVAWAIFYFSSMEKCHQFVTYDVEVGYQRVATESGK